MPGLGWVKLDLHVHTPTSECFRHPDDRKIEAADIVKEALDKGLDGIAITDHMTGAWIDSVKEAASADGKLLVFPGVELSIDYYHVVALFPQNSTTQDILLLLGDLGLKKDDLGKAAPPIKSNPKEVFEAIHSREGLVVLAHIDCEHTGALAGKTKASSRIELLNSFGYDAVEIQADNPPQEIFDSKIAKGLGYKRVPPWYWASDNPKPGDPTKHSIDGIGSKYTWFSGEEGFTLESLRQCFNDPDQRIAQQEESPAEIHPAITGMEIKGGFLNGVSINFHSGLTSIVGGKGVGKSLIVEFLRLALGDISTIDAVAQDHRGKVVSQLGKGSEINVDLITQAGKTYRVVSRVVLTSKLKTGSTYEVEREVLDLASGESIEALPKGILPMRAFSQGEIVEISRDKSKQLIQLDSFVDLEEVQDSICQDRESLQEAVLLLVDSKDAQADVTTLSEKYSTLDEQIKNLDSALQAPVFSTYKESEAANVLVTDALTQWDSLKAPLLDAKNSLEAPALPTTKIDLEVAEKCLQSIVQEQKLAREETLKMLDDGLALIGDHEKSTAANVAAWNHDMDQVTMQYEHHIDEAGGNSKALNSKRKSLQSKFRAAKKDLSNAKELASQWDDAWQSALKLAKKIDSDLHHRFEVRKKKADELTTLSNELLRLSVEKGTDRDSEMQALKDIQSGLHAATLQALTAHAASHWLVLRLLNPGFEHECGIQDDQLEVLREKLFAMDTARHLISGLLETLPEDTPIIEYRRSAGNYAPIEEISQGQRCTALIALTLLEGTSPIIIDQPEDSLDVRAIWDDVVQNVRRKKLQRQFIFTTHNSTIAVAGDSDCITVLEPAGAATHKTHEGSIDLEDIKSSAIDHLEGGPEAFLLRRQKYNISG
jgi:PHP family Zn ribbon phosphoesterase